MEVVAGRRRTLVRRAARLSAAGTTPSASAEPPASSRLGACPRQAVGMAPGESANAPIAVGLADAGYDSEGKHRHARLKKKVRSSMPATLGRPTQKLPTGRFRRLMKQRLDKHFGQYGQRWQAETGFSMVKRCIADTVHGRSYWSQCRELWLVVITFNLLLL